MSLWQVPGSQVGVWGSGQVAGSGVATYDLEVSQNGIDWTRLLTATQAISYEYVGQYGHSYTFRARATDNVSHTTSSEAEASIVQVTKYYHFGGQRIAMREGDVVYYLHGDHLGSTSVASSDSGVLHSRQGYYPYGEVRYVTGELPTEFGFTGQRKDSYVELYQMGARWYNPYLNRFISADTIVPEPASPSDFNRYAYVRNNPLRYTDPDGRTLRSALDLIRQYQGDIRSIAEQYNLDPVLLAGVVFAENRNDYNWIRGQDWSSVFTLRLFGGPEVKNLISPLVKDNPSIGITEVSVAVAAMMDNPGLIPDNYADLSWEERSALHEQIATNLSKDERQCILDSLSNPQTSLEYTAKYLNFLAEYRDYGEDYALWLSDYNRGLSDWDTTTEYGRRIDDYRGNIEHALNWEPTDWICVGGYGCGAAYDRQLYGELP